MKFIVGNFGCLDMSLNNSLKNNISETCLQETCYRLYLLMSNIFYLLVILDSYTTVINDICRRGQFFYKKGKVCKKVCKKCVKVCNSCIL